MAKKTTTLMFNRNRSKAVTAILAVALLTSNAGSASAAAFVDDWLSQKSVTSPSFYQGSQRGYFNGGGFSARIPQGTDNLFTITKPSLNVGCGGINMFLGGMGFVDVDKLVAKLQRILSAAPAAAFDIALKTLAPQVADTIKAIGAWVDKLNNLQLDDCKAAKALVATIADQSPLKNQKLQSEISNAQTTFMQDSGVGSLFNDIKETIKSEESGGGTSQTKKAATDGALTGCPAALKEYFAGGSILEKVGEARGLSTDHIAMFRGYIGDVEVFDSTATGGSYMAVPVGECAKSSFADLISGSIETRSSVSASCSQTTAANKDLRKYVRETMIRYAEKIKSKTAPAPADEALIAAIPLPIFPALRAGIAAGNESAIIEKLVDPSASGLAYQIVLDMDTAVRQVVLQARQVAAKQQNSTGRPETCKIDILAEPLTEFANFSTVLNNKATKTYREYGASQSNNSAIDQLVSGLDKFNQMTKKKLTSRFGRSAAGRYTY